MLNIDQKKAVEHIQGPLLIVAGAGTGKTTTLIEKIAHLIEQKVAQSHEILALTFTDKAASEMEERVDQRLPYGYFQVNISTFHSFADQILRTESSHIGLSPMYRLLTEAETILFMREHLFLFKLKYFRPLGNPNKFLDALLQHFSRLRDEDVTPQQYLAWARRTAKRSDIEKDERAKNLELAVAFQTFQSIKQKEGVVDYADLIAYLLELFRKRPQILGRYRQQHRYIVVDEFQDTNIAQYSLIKLLAPPRKKSHLAKENASVGPNLTVVGDDSQAIYKFRGASVSNILTFMKDYKGAKQISLQKNYRSSQAILDHAYKLIKHNDPDTLEAQLGISKELVAAGAQPGRPKSVRTTIPVQLQVSDRGEDEADEVAKMIQKLHKGYSYSEIAILLRANNHADMFTRALTRRGVPYQFLGPGALFKQPEVKDLIAYLRVLCDLDDSVSLYRVLQMELFEIDPKDISLLLTFAKRSTISLFQAIEIAIGSHDEKYHHTSHDNYKPQLPALAESSLTSLITIHTLISSNLAKIKKETAGQILYYFLQDSGYLQTITQYKTQTDERRALNISRFFDKLKSFEATHEDASVMAVTDYLTMSMELGESPNAIDIDRDTYDAVQILTVHSSKGLEFPVVFLVNLTQDRFPTRERKETIPIPQELIKEMLPVGNAHDLEERRLFYVGMTRAKERLFLTAAQYYGEGKRIRKLSPFVYETLEEQQLVQTLATKKAEKDQLSMFDYKPDTTVIKKNKKDPVATLSFTQIDTYQLCPLRYKYQYILKIPVIAEGVTSMGTSVHAALEQFYTEFAHNKKLGVKRLVDLLHESWIPLGFHSKAHEQEMKHHAETMLRNYFQTYHSEDIRILDLEKLFKIKIHDGDDIFVTGKIDRVDDGSKNAIEIVDYKTGNLPDEKKLKNSLQLSIYLLAASDPGLYGKKVSEITLTFYYLQENKKINVSQSGESVMKAKEVILSTVEHIRAEKFAPKKGPWCNYCPFKMVCEAWQ